MRAPTPAAGGPPAPNASAPVIPARGGWWCPCRKGRGGRPTAGPLPSVGSATRPQRQGIVRCPVGKGTATVGAQGEQVRVTMAWAGGGGGEHALRRPASCCGQSSDSTAPQRRTGALRAAGPSAVASAAAPHAEGWRPPQRCATFRKHPVLRWSSRHGPSGPPAAAKLRRGEGRLKDRAAELRMEWPALRLGRRRGWLHSRLVAATGRGVVWADARELQRRRRVLESGRRHPSTAYPGTTDSQTTPDQVSGKTSTVGSKMPPAVCHYVP
jgi:hypothetical protein